MRNKFMHLPATSSRFVAALVVSVISSLAIIANANDWPCFRGANGDGHTDEKITVWPPVEVWRANVGEGFSQVVVSQNKVYTMGWSGGQNHVVCYSEAATGNNPTPIWTASYTCARGNNQGAYYGNYPTPAVCSGQVFTCDNYGNFNCYSASGGNLLWSSSAFAGSGSDFGGSPFVEGDLVLVNGGNLGVMALSKSTHNVVWGSSGNGGRYTSPYATTIAGNRVIIGYDKNISGFDPATGTVLWSLQWYHGGVPDTSIANGLIIDSNKVFAAQGYGQGCTMANLGSGTLTKVWQNTGLCTKENSPVYYKGYVYGIDENTATLKCIDPLTGTAKWASSDSGVSFNTESSVLSAGDQIVVMAGCCAPLDSTKNGNLVVVQASSSGYNELHRLTGILPDYTFTAPTICNGKLYVRSRDGTLICYTCGAAPVQGCSDKITFPGYTASEILTNFPALVCLSTNINGFDYSQFSSSSGGDLRFTAADGSTPLNYEMDTWNNTGASYVWVQIPQLTAGTYIWAFWGNTGLTAPPYTTNGATWDSTFAGVWHMNETVANGGTQHDSTSHHNDGVWNAAGTSAAGVPGVIGNGNHVNGSGGGLKVTDNASLHVLQQCTFSVWAKSDNPNSTGWDGEMMSKRPDLTLTPHPGNGSAEIMFANYDGSSGRLGCYCGPGAVGQCYEPNEDITQWNYWTGVLNANSGDQYIYFNGYCNMQYNQGTFLEGGPMHRSNANTTMGTGGDLWFGSNPGGNVLGQLMTDEARLESVPRSSNWVWSCYMTMASNKVFQGYSIVAGSGYIPVPGALMFSAAAYSVVENAGTATITVVRTNGTSGTVTVDYTTANGTATAGSDYTAASGTFTFQDGEDTKTFTVAIQDNGLQGPDKTVNLTLSNPTGGGSLTAPSTAVLTIVNDNKPTLQFSSATYEGSSVNSGASATITVTRSKVTAGAASVSYSTANGTASAGTDYTTTSGTLNFADGQTIATFTIPLTQKFVYQADMTVNLSLSNPTGGTYGSILGPQSNAVLTIVGPPMPTIFDAWANRAKITFSGYTKSGTLTNFPALVIFGTNINGFAYSQVASLSGGDVRFTDSTGNNALKYEMDTWSTGGKSYLWVQVPQFSNNCSIWAFWGNPAGTTPPTYTTDGSTWDANFVGVWHMNTTTPPDSTANHLNATTSSGNANAVGIVGGGQSFSSASQTHIVVPNSSKMVFGSADTYTFSAWAFVPVTLPGNDWHALATVSKGTTYYYGIWENGPTWVYGGAPGLWGAGVPVSNSWNSVAIWQNGTANRGVYANGASSGNANGPGNSGTVGTGDMWFGGANAAGTGEYFDGRLDEIRLENCVRSANWEWACYMTMASNTTLTGYGTVRGAGGSSSNPPSITSPTSDNCTVSNAYSYQITASGNPTNYNATGLPAGLTVNRSTGVISGTPTATGSSSITLSAINQYGTGTATLTLTINPQGSGTGSLTGSHVAGSGNTVDLTAEGTDDWAHWGYSGTAIDHKSVSGNAVNHIAETCSGSPLQYANNTNGYSWSDGTPTASATATKTGIYVVNVGSYFTLTAPADTTLRTLKLYIGGWSSAATLTAHLSDTSAADYVDSSFSNMSDSYYAVYTLTYKARSAGQTLSVKWQVASGSGGPNVTLQAATLQGGGSPGPGVDSDGDGMSDADELIAGTDPYSAASVFKITQCKPASTNARILSLSFPSVSGRFYAVQTTTNIHPAAWANVPDPAYTNIPGSGASTAFSTNTSSGASRYFRIQVRAP